MEIVVQLLKGELGNIVKSCFLYKCFSVCTARERKGFPQIEKVLVAEAMFPYAFYKAGVENSYFFPGQKRILEQSDTD